MQNNEEMKQRTVVFPEKPKKKRVKHIQFVNAQVPLELLERLESGACVRNEEIKYAIKTAIGKEEGYV